MNWIDVLAIFLAGVGGGCLAWLVWDTAKTAVRRWLP